MWMAPKINLPLIQEIGELIGLEFTTNSQETKRQIDIFEL